MESIDNKVFTGIVLAGGKSSRFGEDKGLHLFEGQSLVEYAIALLKPFCAELLIVSNDMQYAHFGCRVVSDVFKEKGPMGGIHAGLTASTTTHNLVVSCDMPRLTPDALDYLLFHSDGSACCVPYHFDKTEPLFGLYLKRDVGVIETLIQQNNLKMMNLLDVLGARKIDFDLLVTQTPDLFFNLNHPPKNK